MIPAEDRTTASPDSPPGLESLLATIARMEPEIGALFERFAMTDPGDREVLLAGAVQEALWRTRRTDQGAARLLRSLERRCRDHREATRSDGR